MKEILNVVDLANICNVSEQTIKDLINDGKIPAYKVVRGCWLISRKLFVQYIEKHSDTILDNQTQSDTKDFNE